MNKKADEGVKVKEVKKVEHVETQMGSKAHENIAPASVDVEDTKVAEEKPKKRRYLDVSGGLIFITLGIILLLNNFGLLPWEIWANIWRFWPVFIIIGGLNMLFNSSWWKTVIMFFITALLLVFVLVYSFVNSDVVGMGRIGYWIKNNTGNGNEIYKEFTLDSEVYDDVERMKIYIRNDIGTLKILESDENETPFVVYGWYHDNIVVPDLNHELDDGELSINFEADVKNNWFNWGNSNDNVFKVELGETNVLTELEMNITSGKADVRLDKNSYKKFVAELISGDLDILLEDDAQINEYLKIDVVSGNAVIDLRDAEQLPELIEIEVTSGNTELLLPEKVGVNLEYDVITGAVKIDGEKLRGEGKYDIEMEERVNIKVKVTSGNVEIKY